MKLDDAEELARSLMYSHTIEWWDFKFDNAVSRFGSCDFRTHTITLSRHLTELNDEATVKQAILHEIAHAMVGPEHTHDDRWRRAALAIGHDASRLYYDDEVRTPPGRWIGTCPVCGHQTKPRHRRRTVSCGQCCETFNPQFQLVWTEVGEAGDP